MPETAAAGGGSFLPMLGYLGFFIILFYFLLVRPQQKQKKQRQEMLNSLQVGANIFTVGGILGKITETNEETFKILIANGVEIEVLKTSVGGIKKEETEFAPGEFKYDDNEEDDEQYEYVYEDDTAETEDEKQK
ncbi:MAG: preprotein translocase subunit YajC [Clostridia bacterium]|nr:preprotein translocase subunit YajC [Clostridia bacterium]MDD4799372.1 preprotein translocase subunit YajC [Clostridia bacterium]